MILVSDCQSLKINYYYCHVTLFVTVMRELLIMCACAKIASNASVYTLYSVPLIVKFAYFSLNGFYLENNHQFSHARPITWSLYQISLTVDLHPGNCYSVCKQKVGGTWAMQVKLFVISLKWNIFSPQILGISCLMSIHAHACSWILLTVYSRPTVYYYGMYTKKPCLIMWHFERSFHQTNMAGFP